MRGKCNHYFLFSRIHLSTSQTLYEAKNLLDVVCNQQMLITEIAGLFLHNGQGQNVLLLAVYSVSLYLFFVNQCFIIQLGVKDLCLGLLPLILATIYPVS